MKLPAGKYFIGDPCYAFNEDDWDKIVEMVYPPGVENPVEGIHTFNGHQLYMHHTAYGDGTYFGDEEYGVDSGSLGMVPVELISKRTIEELESLGRIATFDAPVEVDYEDGVFYFGAEEINTKNDWNDDNETWDDEEVDVDFEDEE